MRNILLISLCVLAPSAWAGEAVDFPKLDWSFHGVPEGWDKQKILRGYTVATQVCLSCHGFKYISHRDLLRVGVSEAQAAELAAALSLKLNDPIKSPLEDATANEMYGKVPPDLSVMNRARLGGADYVHALLTGYAPDDKIPEEYTHALPHGIPEGAHFNKYFPGHAIAMPAPFASDGQVTYLDGHSPTIEEMSQDVSYFMEWTAEPELIQRKQLGIYVLIYLVIFTILAYLVKRSVWKNIKH